MDMKDISVLISLVANYSIRWIILFIASHFATISFVTLRYAITLIVGGAAHAVVVAHSRLLHQFAHLVDGDIDVDAIQGELFTHKVIVVFDLPAVLGHDLMEILNRQLFEYSLIVAVDVRCIAMNRVHDIGHISLSVDDGFLLLLDAVDEWCIELLMFLIDLIYQVVEVGAVLLR